MPSNTEALVRAVLDGKPLQARKDGLIPLWTDVEPRQVEDMLRFIVPNIFRYEFRVKPTIKVVKYQTRLYSVGATPNRTVYLWSDRTGCYSQNALERSYITLEWLQPTQEHTFEYEETE